jgi:hypothetical protein
VVFFDCGHVDGFSHQFNLDAKRPDFSAFARNFFATQSMYATELARAAEPGRVEEFFTSPPAFAPGDLRHGLNASLARVFRSE